MAVAMAPSLEGSSMVEAKAPRLKAKAKAKRPTWAEYLAMEKRLDSMQETMNNINLEINLENIRGCFGDTFVQAIFAQETTKQEQEQEQESSSLVLMCEVLRLVSAYEKRSPPKPKPRRVEDLEKLLSCVRREFLQLASEKAKRGPDFSGMTEADRAAEAERIREEALQKARRLVEAAGGDTNKGLYMEAKARILDFDPKQGGIYYNSFWLTNLATFDLGEESPIGPMRFTNKVYQEKEMELYEAVNILSVKVARSDVGFPIHVYGTVIVRDCIDYKRIYLFHRDRQHCQLINSKDEPLILTGPKRALALLNDNYVETDLKIKDHQGQDRELSKGVLTISGTAGRSEDKCEVEQLSLATRLSTVKVEYAFVISAVEATIAIEVDDGEFLGRVTAHTASIKKRLVLYDSQLADQMPGNGLGSIKMMRPVISVSFGDPLIITVRSHGGKAVCFEIDPRISKVDEVEFSLGTAKMRLRVAWSMVDPLIGAQGASFVDRT